MNPAALPAVRGLSLAPRPSSALRCRTVKAPARTRAPLRIRAVAISPPLELERAPGSLLNADEAGPFLRPEEATWGPDAPEWVAEWRRNLDLKGFGSEMRALEKEMKKNQTEEDVGHLKRVLLASNVCYFLGLALVAVCNPFQGNFISAFLISTGIFARWTMVGHHTSHGGYSREQLNDDGTFGRFHRAKFGKGLYRRVVDWLDWMKPEAWDVEHNNLHHYKLGESYGDPDLVEKHFADVRTNETMPMAYRYARSFFLMFVWKWFYYAPSTLHIMNEYWASKAKNNKKYENFKPLFNNAVTAAPTVELGVKEMIFEGNFRPLVELGKCLLPQFAWHFCAVPLPFYVFGGAAMGNMVMVNMVAAELITNLHSFIAIVTNHCGKDVYRFDTPVAPKSDEFYLRAIIGSVNFRTAYTTPGRPEGKPAGWLGEANDFMHGYLNYQIEHHMFPDLSMQSYQKCMPRVKEACARYGIPYVQESVWIRVKRTIDIMVGKENMLVWERGM